MTEIISPKATPEQLAQPKSLLEKVAELAQYVHDHPEEADAIRHALAGLNREEGASTAPQSTASLPEASLPTLPSIDAHSSESHTQVAPVHDQDTSPESNASYENDPLDVTVGFREKKDAYHTVSEDYLKVDRDNGIFIVADGMGGEGGQPDAASRAAAEAVYKSLMDEDQPTDPQDLGRALFDAFKKGRKNVTENGGQGSTVITAAKLAKINGETYIGVGHAGDTRFMMYHPDEDRYEDITPDQSSGNVVDNAFIHGEVGNARDHYGLIQFKKRDTGPRRIRFMMCSDGITGDWASQFLTEAEMKDAFTQPTPDAAAQRFLELSKKHDDKTVVVFDLLV